MPTGPLIGGTQASNIAPPSLYACRPCSFRQDASLQNLPNLTLVTEIGRFSFSIDETSRLAGGAATIVRFGPPRFLAERESITRLE